MLSIEFQPDADASNIGRYMQKLMDAVNAKLFSQQKSTDSDPLVSFQTSIEVVRDQIYFIVSKLKGISPQDHTASWVAVLHELYDGLFSIREDFEALMAGDDSGTPLAITAEEYNKVRAPVGQLYSEINEVFISFVEDPVIVDRLVSLCGTGVAARELVVKVLEFAFVAAHMNLAVDCGSINNSTAMLQPVSSFVRLLLDIELESGEGNAAQTLGLWAKYAKALYVTGNSSLFQDIYTAQVTPELPLTLFKGRRIVHTDVARFYKYTAFNLFALSVQSFTTIDEKYAWDADSFFKCLLVLPSMDYNMPPLSTAYDRDPVLQMQRFQMQRFRAVQGGEAPWGQENRWSQSSTSTPQWGAGANKFPVEDENAGDEHSVAKRQEVSLLFILNSIVMAHSLEEIVSPVPQLQQEIDHLSQTLTSSLSNKIRREGSNLKSGWGTTMAAPWYQVNGAADSSRSQSLTSILLNGSYRDKQTGVLQFVSALKKGSFQSLQTSYSLDKEGGEFRELYESTDADWHPGYVQYMQLLHFVSRFFGLLYLKYIIKNVGGTMFTLSKLHTILGSTSVSDIFRIKHFFDYEIGNGTEPVYHIRLAKHFNPDKQDMISHQLEVSKETAQLESLVNSLEAANLFSSQRRPSTHDLGTRSRLSAR